MLQADARRPNTDIARRLGVAETTVRNRIARLTRDGVVQCGAWTDPLKVGYQTYAIIQIQVAPPRLEKVADVLAAAARRCSSWASPPAASTSSPPRSSAPTSTSTSS